MKKLTSLCLAVVLSGALCACGQPANDAAAPTEPPKAETTVPPNMSSVLPGADASGTDAPAEPAAPAAEPSETLALAQSMVGRSIDELLELLGEPDAVDHAPSCLGDGEDGEYHFGELIVYTYRDGSGEYIREVVG